MKNYGVSVAIFFVLVFFGLFSHQVSEQHIDSQEHQAAYEGGETLIIDSEELALYQASCNEEELVFGTQAYHGGGTYQEQQKKKQSDILALCRAAYGYANMACGEVEGFYQNKYKQKQILSMMHQRINNYGRGITKNTYFDELGSLVKQDLATVTALNPLKDQKNHGNGQLKDCYALDTTMKSLHDNGNRHKKLQSDSTLHYNINLKRYDNIMYFDLPQRQEHGEQLEYSVVQPWYNHRAFRDFVDEVIQPRDTQRYIQYEAIKNEDNNREQYKDWLHRQGMTLASKTQASETPSPQPIMDNTPPQAPIVQPIVTPTPVPTPPKKEEPVDEQHSAPAVILLPGNAYTAPQYKSTVTPTPEDTPTTVNNPYLQHTNGTTNTYSPY